MKKFEVVCVGRAAEDILLSGDVFNPICSHGSCYEHIPLGGKIHADDAQRMYGGNAFNASFTFARQGLDTALLAQVGEGASSRVVLEMMHGEGISRELINVNDEYKLPVSTILVAPNGERAIISYGGSDVDYERLLTSLGGVDTDWLYVSSLNSMELLNGVIGFGNLNSIKIAFNPGGKELENIDQVKQLLPAVEVLILNRGEAKKFFGDLDPASLAKAGSEYVAVCVVTDGQMGAWAHSGADNYYQPIAGEVKVVDRTGAGDAFASGFVAGLVKGRSIKKSLELGAINSTNVVQFYGAQKGILNGAG